MSRDLRSILWTILRVGFGLALFAYVVAKAKPWLEAEHILANPFLFVVVLSIPLFNAALEALRLGTVMRAIFAPLRFGTGYWLVAVATYFSLFVPGGTGGDAAKFYYLAAHQRGRRVELASAVAIDRFAGLASLLILIVTLGVINLQVIRKQGALGSVITGALAILVVCVFFMTCLSSDKFRGSRFAKVLFSHLPFQSHVVRLLDSIDAFQRNRWAVVATVLFSLAGNLLLCLMFVIVGKSLMPQMQPTLLCFLALAGMVVNALPITPGGIGVGEAASEGLFHLFGQPGGANLILVWRVAMLPVAALGCAFYVRGWKAEPNPQEAYERADSPTGPSTGGTVQP